jgi:Na+-translocating ferredoxin:NAD+ oxidoreductase RnfE subunit
MVGGELVNNTILQRKINRELMHLEKHKTDHLFHLLLAVLSAGVWLPIWIMVAAVNANERMKSEKRIESLEMVLGLVAVE